MEDVNKIRDVYEAYYNELYAIDVLPNVDFEEFLDIILSFTISEQMTKFLQSEVTKEEVLGVSRHT